jgi:hypothetical protein
MKNLSVLMVLFAVLFSSTTYAQKSKKLKYGIQVMVLDDFNPNSSITVFSSGKDPLGLRDLIEGELMFSSSQLKVISPQLARETVSATNDVNVSENGSDIDMNQKIEVQTKSVTQLASVYALSFSYTWNPETYGLMGFNGQIVDLADGAILVKFRKPGGSIGFGKGKKKVVAIIIEEINRLSAN